MGCLEVIFEIMGQFIGSIIISAIPPRVYLFAALLIGTAACVFRIVSGGVGSLGMTALVFVVISVVCLFLAVYAWSHRA